MTRVLHVADLHQGLLTHSVPDPATGLPSALVSAGRCWRAATQIAVERGVDAVIVAGDTFHGPNPDAAALTQFARGLQILKGERIPVVIIAGNHDRAPDGRRPSVIEAFHDPRGGVHAVVTPRVVHAGDLDVACLPSVSRHWLLATGDARYRAQADQQIVDSLRRITDSLRAYSAQILTGHWPVSGTVIGTEADIAIIPEPMLAPADLDGPWPLVAFGHIHKSQTFPISADTLGVYAGAIDRMNFGEADGAPVAIEVQIPDDAPDGPAQVQAHDLPARRFLTLKPEDVLDGPPADASGAIVRVPDVPEDVAGEVRARLQGFGAQTVYVQPRRARRDGDVREGAAQIGSATGVLEALDVWLEALKVPEEDRPEIRDRAKRLLEGGSV